MTAFADVPQARSGTRLFPGRTERITGTPSGRVAWARLDWVATVKSNGNGADPGHVEPR